MKLYKCDPTKNVQCKKTICYMNHPQLKETCNCTVHAKFAALDASGDLIIESEGKEDYNEK